MFNIKEMKKVHLHDGNIQDKFLAIKKYFILRHIYNVINVDKLNLFCCA